MLTLGVTRVLTLVKYFTVVVIVSISTFCLFLNSNGGFLTTVVGSSARTPASLALGNVLGDKSGTDSAAVDRLGLSVGEQVWHIPWASVAEN